MWMNYETLECRPQENVLLAWGYVEGVSKTFVEHIYNFRPASNYKECRIDYFFIPDIRFCYGIFLKTHSEIHAFFYKKHNYKKQRPISAKTL